MAIQVNGPRPAVLKQCMTSITE